MEESDASPSAAAQLVLKERQRLKADKHVTTPSSHDSPDPQSEPHIEVVSVPDWKSSQNADIDESELDRRQRALSEKLELKQLEVQRQGRRLAKVRDELKALEQPMKAEIMKLRQSLEDANRSEISLVDTVNTLRKQLFQHEQSLKQVREQKQSLADSLIQVMADYEKRKTERLNEIAELVGTEPVQHLSKKHNFSGF